MQRKSKIQPYHDSQTYIQFMRTLMRGNGLCLKDFIRYSIFYVSPNLYQILIFKMRKKKTMKISVVIPVYNKEKNIWMIYFNACLAKHLKSLNVFLIDDGSTDASGEICDKVACIDKKI